MRSADHHPTDHRTGVFQCLIIARIVEIDFAVRIEAHAIFKSFTLATSDARSHARIISAISLSLFFLWRR